MSTDPTALKSVAQLTVLDPIVAEHTTAIHRLRKRVRKDLAEVGSRLAAVCEHLEHGDWLAWLEAEFDWSDQTARNFIHVYEAQQSSEFKTVLNSSLPLKALYQLAAPKTPHAARQEVAARIEAGEEPTATEVTKIIAEAKGKSDDQAFQEAAAKAIGGKRKNKTTAPSTDNTESPDASADRMRAKHAAADDEFHREPVTTAPPDYEGGVSVLAQVLADYFATATGASILNNITYAANRIDLVREFLDALGIDAMLEAASPEFKKQLSARVPTKPSAWLVEKDAGTIAQTIADTVGMTKADAVRTHLLNLAVPKRQVGKPGQSNKPFKTTMQMEPAGTDASGNPNFAEQPRKRSQVH